MTVREEARRVGIVKEKEAKGQKQEEDEEEAVVAVGTGKEGEGAWEGEGAGGVSMPGKELVKRMKDVSGRKLRFWVFLSGLSTDHDLKLSRVGSGHPLPDPAGPNPRGLTRPVLQPCFLFLSERSET